MQRRTNDQAGRAEAAIYQDLHTAITEHRLPAGSRLVEEQLASAYQVSRTRIRAVLHRLARDRMVTVQRNRGACVSYPSADEAREVFQARRLLESALTRRAAATMTADAFRRLAAHIEAEAHAAKSGDRRAAIRLSGEFHMLVAAIAGNPTLTRYLSELIARSSVVVAVYERPGLANCSADEHGAVIGALATGDAETAVQRMDAHLAEVEGRLNLDAAPPRDFDVSTLFAAE